MTQIVKVEPQEVAQVQPQGSILAVIARAAADPSVDVTKMSALLELQERVMQKHAEAEYNAAMSRLQPRLPRITKKGKIQYEDKKTGKLVSTPFAKYEDIDAAIRPMLCEEGFSISFGTQTRDGGGLIISATLSHNAGHSRTESMPLPADTSGSKNAIQAMGSTLSYGKRYLVCAMLNIITEGEDNDGNLDGAITEEQVKTIEDLLHECGLGVRTEGRTKFLETFGVAAVEDIHKAAYPGVFNVLHQKRRSVKK